MFQVNLSGFSLFFQLQTIVSDFWSSSVQCAKQKIKWKIDESPLIMKQAVWLDTSIFKTIIQISNFRKFISIYFLGLFIWISQISLFEIRIIVLKINVSTRYIKALSQVRICPCAGIFQNIPGYIPGQNRTRFPEIAYSSVLPLMRDWFLFFCLPSGSDGRQKNGTSHVLRVDIGICI